MSTLPSILEIVLWLSCGLSIGGVMRGVLSHDSGLDTFIAILKSLAEAAVLGYVAWQAADLALVYALLFYATLVTVVHFGLDLGLDFLLPRLPSNASISPNPNSAAAPVSTS